MSFSIDPIVPSDQQAWSRLFTAYLTFYHTSLPESQYHNTFSRLTDPSGDLHGFILRDGASGREIGLAHFLYHGNPWTDRLHCYLSDLYVDEEGRGKGYGTALIKKVEECAKEKGCARLYVRYPPNHTTPHLDAAPFPCKVLPLLRFHTSTKRS